MDQVVKAQAFGALHVRGTPLVLYNAWDAGSALATVRGGAPAVATGSWSIAAAQGYGDGEAIPLSLVEQIVHRIAATVDVPVTVDFEGGYAIDPAQVAANVERIVRAGAVGINFEDGVVGGAGLHDMEAQCRRIAAIRERADRLGIPLFINARTDLFLQAGDAGRHPTLVNEAVERAARYGQAGASGFFVPGLTDAALIRAICDAVPLAVNIMMTDILPPSDDLRRASGVSRISYGPFPYQRCLQQVQAAVSNVL